MFFRHCSAGFYGVNRRLYQLLLSLLATLVAFPALAARVNVAVASNFTAPMKALTAEFEKKTGHQVRLSFGSSGKFYAQINHGAPFQLFLSADQAKPAALEKRQMILPGSRFTYAIGSLALWSPDKDVVMADGGILNQSHWHKLAIANPKLAPYGAAARDTLTALGLYPRLRGKLVRGENIAQAYQFVASGNAELGFVAMSQILSDGQLQRGSMWRVPESLYRPIRQDAVLLKSAADNPAALALSQYLRSNEVQTLISRYGYQPPRVNNGNNS